MRYIGKHRLHRFLALGVSGLRKLAGKQDAAAMVAAYWKKIGVTVNLKMLDPSTFTSTCYAGKQSQITLSLDSVGGYTFPEAQVLCIPGSARNWSKWADPVFQGYIDEGYAARDTATWDDVMRKIQLRFLGQLPVILLPAP